VNREADMRTLDDIMTQLRALQPDLKRRYPIQGMGVFGSYVRGEQRDDSDLDLLVDLGDGMGLIEVVGLQLELSDALGITVDLVEREALRPRIAPHVLAEVIPL
jgi:predicted nucleotidyltransferase